MWGFGPGGGGGKCDRQEVGSNDQGGMGGGPSGKKTSSPVWMQ